jgi:hypothetical protein
MLRQINPQLSLHYWDWTQDPRSIPGANLGGGSTGNLDLFTSDFMGSKSGAIVGVTGLVGAFGGSAAKAVPVAKIARSIRGKQFSWKSSVGG